VFAQGDRCVLGATPTSGFVGPFGRLLHKGVDRWGLANEDADIHRRELQPSGPTGQGCATPIRGLPPSGEGSAPSPPPLARACARRDMLRQCNAPRPTMQPPTLRSPASVCPPPGLLYSRTRERTTAHASTAASPAHSRAREARGRRAILRAAFALGLTRQAHTLSVPRTPTPACALGGRWGVIALAVYQLG